MNEDTHRRLPLRVGWLPMGNHAISTHLIGEVITNSNLFCPYSGNFRFHGFPMTNFINIWVHVVISRTFQYLFSSKWINLSHALYMPQNLLNKLFACVISIRPVKQNFSTLSLNIMGADPILKSAIRRQGSRHSNQGGK